MAFTERSTVESLPGELSIFGELIAANQNFLVQNLDLTVDDIQPWGFLIFQIYVPFPVDRFSTLLTVPCYTDSILVINPLPALGSLNLRICFYRSQSSAPATVRLWTE